jgi:hypothetical protein
MRNIIKILAELGPSVYHEDSEKPFVEEASTFYFILNLNSLLNAVIVGTICRKLREG